MSEKLPITGALSSVAAAVKAEAAEFAKVNTSVGPKGEKIVAKPTPQWLGAVIKHHLSAQSSAVEAALAESVESML